MVSPSAEENINTSVIQIEQLRPQNYASYCVMEARCGDAPLQCQNTGESAVDGQPVYRAGVRPGQHETLFAK